jgi:hypothetical protein
MRTLLAVTALLEAATGALLLFSPSVLASLLLGAPLGTVAGSVVARVAGAALLALGVACWLAKNDGASRAAQGLLAAILLYNVVAAALLGLSWTRWQLSGVALVPAMILHLGLAVWCLVCLRAATVAANRGTP